MQTHHGRQMLRFLSCSSRPIRSGSAAHFHVMERGTHLNIADEMAAVDREITANERRERQRAEQQERAERLRSHKPR
jgi:hypothetical protein